MEEGEDIIDLSILEYKNDTKSKKEPKPKKEEVKEQKEQAKLIKEIEKAAKKPTKKNQQKEVLSEDEAINKRRIILTIEFYINEFPEKLKGFKKINFEKKTIDELNELKKELDFIISNKSSVKQGTQMIIAGINTLEYISCNFTPINCKGLSNICNDEDTINDMKHICLKRMSLINTEPEARLMYKILTHMVLLHNLNSSQAAIMEDASVRIRAINNNFVDL